MKQLVPLGECIISYFNNYRLLYVLLDTGPRDFRKPEGGGGGSQLALGYLLSSLVRAVNYGFV